MHLKVSSCFWQLISKWLTKERGRLFWVHCPDFLEKIKTKHQQHSEDCLVSIKSKVIYTADVYSVYIGFFFLLLKKSLQLLHFGGGHHSECTFLFLLFLQIRIPRWNLSLAHWRILTSSIYYPNCTALKSPEASDFHLISCHKIRLPFVPWQ